jgi:hypothetical protein
MVLLFDPLNQISFVPSDTLVTILSLLCCIIHCCRLCFFCDQRYTTERENIHLQQSQETSNVISERLVFIDIKKSSPTKISPKYAPVFRLKYVNMTRKNMTLYFKIVSYSCVTANL